MKLLDVLEKRDNREILDGLGSVIPEDRKSFVKQKLLSETKELVKMQLDIRN